MNHIVYTLILLMSATSKMETAQFTISQHRRSLTILYLTDLPLPPKIDVHFARFREKISNTTGEDRIVKLQTQVLPKTFGTLFPLLHTLNNSLFWTETGIIILDVKEEKLRGISMLNCAGVVFDVRTRPRTSQKTFPGTMSVKPSLTRLHEAVKRIFGQIGWTSMAEIPCYSHENIENVQPTLKHIKANASTFIFVKCLDNLENVLKYANTIGLTTSDYRWVFPGTVCLQEIKSYLPKNVIAIDLPRSSLRVKSPVEEDVLFLQDVLSVLEITLTNNSQKLSEENEWTSRQFTTFLKRYFTSRPFPGYTGDVIFDQEGRRSGENYEIFELITFNQDRKWLPIGSLEKGNVNILFNQWGLDDKDGEQEIPELRVVTLLMPPFVQYSSQQVPLRSPSGCEVGHRCRRYTNVTSSSAPDGEYEDFCCTGFVMELLKRLETEVRFRGVVHLVKDGKFGSNDPRTHQWNGMIGELVRNEADMAVSTLTITAKRSKVVDFTYPYVDAANGILVSTQPTSHNVWEFVFLDTFSGPLWLTLFIAIQIVIVILWLAERLRQRRRFINDPYKRDNSISYAEIINYTWSLVFQKASEELGPSTIGGRTVAALFAFCTIIACSSFTANLAAIKVSERKGISISGIHDSKFQNANGDFKFGTLTDSANLDFFRDSDDAKFQRIYRQLQKNVVTSTDEGAKKVVNREWTAYIDDIPQLTNVVFKQKDCTLKIVGDPFFFSGYGIALQKNSSWNTRLSLVITKLVREGFIENLKSKWLTSSCGNSKQADIEEMGLNDIGGAFLIVGFGCLAAGLLLGVEYAVWRVISETAQPINDDSQARNINRTFSGFIKVFTLWDINSSTAPVSQAEATLRNFRALTQQKQLEDCASTRKAIHDNK